jgi:hypothetical protein
VIWGTTIRNLSLKAVISSTHRPLPPRRAAAYETAFVIDRDIVVFRISGAFFFGAPANIAATIDRTGERPSAYVLEFRTFVSLTLRPPRPLPTLFYVPPETALQLRSLVFKLSCAVCYAPV